MTQLKRRGCRQCHQGPMKKAYEDESDDFAFYVHLCGYCDTVHVPVNGLTEGWRPEVYRDAENAGLLKKVGENTWEVVDEVYEQWRCRKIGLEV